MPSSFPLTPARALTLAIVSNILGGSAYFALERALEVWPPALLVEARLVLALPLFWLSAPRGSFARATRRDAWRVILVGTVGFAAPLLISAHGLIGSDSSHGAILIGLEPVALVLLARLFLGETLTLRQLLSFGLAITGAVAVVTDGDLGALRALEGRVRSNALLAITALLWGIYTVAAKPTLDRVPAAAFSAATSSVAALAVLPFALKQSSGFEVAPAFATVPLSALVFLVLGVSYGAVVSWNLALSAIPASRMAVLVLLQPVTGILLGALGGEPTTPGKAFGATLVLAAIWLSADKKHG
ncbi:MAG: DMT family transporter [Deltaproteobacteria bacterium]|nr:DMT family transporter [Deltaproteobacteria bacterium]